MPLIDHTDEPRISDFWLYGDYLLDHSDNEAPRYWYGIEEVDGELVVHRFRARSNLALWIERGRGKRRHIIAKETIVQRAKSRNLWPDDGEEVLT